MAKLEQSTESASDAACLEGAPLWLHLVTHLDPRYGGLSAAVPQLCHALTQGEQLPTQIAAFCLPDELASVNELPGMAISYWPAGRAPWVRQSRLRRSFRDLVSSVDGLHLHGLWEQSTAIGARAARKRGLPYVVSAHGMLEPWALRQKRFKKALYGALVERPSLDGAACLHALTEAEAEDYRRFGCTAPIVVIPNGVRIPQKVTSTAFLQHYPDLCGKRIVLFLGRIHPKKGVELLLRAWKNVSTVNPDARLVLAGPDSLQTRSRLESLAASLGIGRQILFTGMLEGEQKWSALASAECFVLPSFSEGLSIAVLEAMGAGLPVVISDRCNLPEVAKINAGQVISTDANELENALSRVMGQEPERNRQTGARGRAFVLENYNWPVVASKMTAVYQWLSAGGAEPDTLLRSGQNTGHQ